jgi:hypothetical protein
VPSSDNVAPYKFSLDFDYFMPPPKRRIFASRIFLS